MNGVELAREAGRLRPELQVLLASGYPWPRSRATMAARSSMIPVPQQALPQRATGAALRAL